jgi:hypothetical protein
MVLERWEMAANEMGDESESSMEEKTTGTTPVQCKSRKISVLITEVEIGGTKGVVPRAANGGDRSLFTTNTDGSGRGSEGKTPPSVLVSTSTSVIYAHGINCFL